MPLPPWASEAVTKITDRSHLVIVEGRLYDKVQGGTTPDYQVVLVLAAVSPHPGGRTELQPLGLVLDTHLGESVEIDDDAVMYSFVEDPG